VGWDAARYLEHDSLVADERDRAGIRREAAPVDVGDDDRSSGRPKASDDSLAQRLSPDIEQLAERHSRPLAYIDHARGIRGPRRVRAASAEHRRIGAERERRSDADSRWNRDYVLMGEHLEVSTEALAGPSGAVLAVDRCRGPNAGGRCGRPVSRPWADRQR